MTVSPSEALREFHEFFGLPARDELTHPDTDEIVLRQTLLEEEFDELAHELDFGHEMQLALAYKELADLVYVCYGLDQHLGSKLDAVFDEVHRSNMTKLWDCWDCGGYGWERPPTVEGYDGIECSGCDGHGKRPKYREDGKVLKPPTYEPPDILKVITQ